MEPSSFTNFNFHNNNTNNNNNNNNYYYYHLLLLSFIPKYLYSIETIYFFKAIIYIFFSNKLVQKKDQCLAHLKIFRTEGVVVTENG